MKNFFINHLKLKGHYYELNRQVPIIKLSPNARTGDHFELDAVLLIGKTAIIIEYTTQKEDNKNKIKKFNRNCNYFQKSELSLKERYRLLGHNIPEEKLEDFEEINNTKYVFIGTSDEIDTKDYTPKDFPEYPDIQSNLIIIGRNNIQYFIQLAEIIKAYAKYEFFSCVGIRPIDLGDQSGHLIKKESLILENKYVTENDSIKADIYQMIFNVDELLKIGRVSRYEGMPLTIEDSKSSYQRFLIESKLKNIADKFIRNDKRRAFPNTVTIVLSERCSVESREDTTSNYCELKIPNEYGSVEIIDGQHRLFAYTDDTIEENTLKNSSILASAIKFRENDPKKISRYAAKIFCEINSQQAKVKNSLIYLMKYDVLGDTDTKAIAGKILLECNRNSGALNNLLSTNTMIKTNRFGLPPIPIVTIVDNSLVQFLDCIGETKKSSSESFESVFGHDEDYLLENPEERWKQGKRVISRYFSFISEVFLYDWCSQSSSNLLSSKYIAALIRYCSYLLIDKEKNISEVRTYLETLKKKVDSITDPAPEQPSFPKGDTEIPTTNMGVKTIYEFLKKPEEWKINNK